MSASYRVVAPYVTLKVKDSAGSEVTLGYYRGAVIEDPVKGDHLDKLVDSDYIESVGGLKDTVGPLGAADLDAVESAKKSTASNKSNR